MSLLLTSRQATAQTVDIEELILNAQEKEASGAESREMLARWLQIEDAIKRQEQEPSALVSKAIANIYFQEQLYKLALPYYQSAFDETKRDAQALNLFYQLGTCYTSISEPDSAYQFYNLIHTHHQKNNSIELQAKSLQMIVDAYAINGKHTKALKYNLQLKGLLQTNKQPQESIMRIFNNLGYNYNHLKQYETAIQYFKDALEICSPDDHNSRAIMNVNIGIAYYNLGTFDESISFLNEAKKEKEKYAPNSTDEIHHLISTVYLRKKDYHNALIFSDRSTQLAKANQNQNLLTDIFYTTALIHSELYEFDLALDYFQKHLQLRDSFQLEERFERQQLLQQKIELERREKETKLQLSSEQLQELTITQLETEKINQQLQLDKQAAQLASELNEKELLKKENEIKASKIETQELETQRAKQELELARQKLLASKQERAVISLQQKDALQQLEIEKTAVQLASEQQEKDLLKKEKQIGELALQQQEERVQSFYKLAGLGALVTLIIAGGLLYSRRLNRELNHKNTAIEKQKAEITHERNKSDQLLLNILPEETAQELKEKGFASPKRYDNATVLFTDFSGFTRISANMSPEELIEELNYCFRNFDTILEKYGLEKIKTIGDAYMCVAGVPTPDKQHAIHSIQAGRDIVAFMNQRYKEKQAAGVDYWKMRMGIHSGSVVAGVVGKKKFAYDIWGDTVNVASRMESNGEVGRINISEATYELIKESFECEHRGKIHAKNVGEINMFFVD